MTNNPLALRGVNGNSPQGRRYRDLVHSFAADLGGVDMLGEADMALCRQTAANILAAEDLQAEIVGGKDVDIEQLTRLTNVTTRLLGRLKARAKPKAQSPLATHFANPPAANS